MVRPEKPARGEVWFTDFAPARGHEQGGKRPCVIVSIDRFNQGPSGLAIVVPLTSKLKPVPSHVEVSAAESGLSQRSFVICEQVRCLSQERLVRRLGRVSDSAMAEIEDWLRVFLGL